MSVRRIAQEQPEKFEFNAENMIWAEELIKKCLIFINFTRILKKMKCD